MRNSKKHPQLRRPDGPKNPRLVQMLQWIADPIGYLETASKHYGDIFTAQVGWGVAPHVFVSNPQAIQQILTSESKQFSPYSELFINFMKPFLGEHSIMRVEGDRHRRQRQLLMPPFHGERMRAYGAQISSITERVMSRLDQSKPFKARNVMLNISLEVISQVVFGLQSGERSERLKQLLNAWLDAMSSPAFPIFLLLPFLQKDLGARSPWGYIQNRNKALSELLYAEIRERRQKYDPSDNDIMTLLLSAKDEAGVGMTDEELYDELLTLLLVGHETTATAITWALCWVHHQPEIRNKLFEELDTLGDSSDPMAISRLPYLTAVCFESLRIYPVLPLNLPHVVREPVELMGYQLEPGTKVVANIYLTHHRQDIYPEPERFKPERFLERQFSAYEYLPFGSGSRRCVGAALAQLEMKLVLATILSHYQLALSDSRPVRPQLQFGSFIVPQGGVKMVIEGERYRVAPKAGKSDVKTENLI
ncbi:cytochrome P450 [Cylindrospermum stagnale PCC 7417]|uniref:Cytochrome P450 n=1 Tax=Cylindrospermum stagnale PCC 7417 TaxID=56107 RepID=K9WZ87_9NOST|nr:cytochrome P450 [Cylindrospermum stagnale]AFZ24837.1 cytochrome P450 [Cylindrospermum stagnale PCC 7417]